MATSVSRTRTVLVGDTNIEIAEAGTGDALILLHGHDGAVDPDGSFFQFLARDRHVIEPIHPGFGSDEIPDWIDSVDDLAYLYLSLLEKLAITGATLVGLSMGGWIAAEIATKCRHRIARLVLVSPVGIQVGERDARDIPDIFAMTPDERAALNYADAAAAPKLAELSDSDLARVVRNDQAAALFLWQPYMCNPKLRRRLAAIDVPTLIIRGESDGIVSAAYAEAYRAAIPGAQLVTLEGAGHMAQCERPVALGATIEAFLAGTTDGRASQQ